MSDDDTIPVWTPPPPHPHPLPFPPGEVVFAATTPTPSR